MYEREVNNRPKVFILYNVRRTLGKLEEKLTILSAGESFWENLDQDVIEYILKTKLMTWYCFGFVRRLPLKYVLQVYPLMGLLVLNTYVGEFFSWLYQNWG